MYIMLLTMVNIMLSLMSVGVAVSMWREAEHDKYTDLHSTDELVLLLNLRKVHSRDKDGNN